MSAAVDQRWENLRGSSSPHNSCELSWGPAWTHEDPGRPPEITDSSRSHLFSIFVAAADGAVPGWRAFLQGSAGMSNGERREAMVPLRFVPLTSHRLRSTILRIIIVIECRWCRFPQGECRVGVWGRTGVAGPAGGSSQDKTHQLQAVDSHCADRRILRYCNLNPADMKGGGLSFNTTITCAGTWASDPPNVQIQLEENVLIRTGRI